MLSIFLSSPPPADDDDDGEMQDAVDSSIRGLRKKTSAQSNSTKGRIAAAHRRYIPYTLQWAVHSPPLEIAHSHRDLDLPFNTWFLGPARVHNTKSISIGSAIFAGLTIVTDTRTDRETDRQIARPRYSVCNNRLCQRT